MLPNILIADDPEALRSYAIIRRDGGMLIYEIFDTAPAEGVSVALPRDNGDLVLREKWGDAEASHYLLLQDAERIAGVLEEIEFRDTGGKGV